MLETVFKVHLLYNNSQAAVEERKELLRQMKIGICDIVESCQRKQIDASDLGMTNIRLRDLLGEIECHPAIKQLLFMGGDTKNGPEFLFRKQLRDHGIKSLCCIKQTTPKIHEFSWKGRQIQTVSLTSPSSAANRAIGGSPSFKKRKMQFPDYSPFDFRVEQYRPFFLT